MAASPVSFFAQTWDELKKVTWPSRAEVIRLTGVVIVVSLIVGGFLGGVDFLLTKIMAGLIK
ncbi:MAG TPA: preprotein translocase subunit SecE [Candidatus Saccharimonadales bacterium]|nr:preprotein translocase subunit SecE [Candidatus Saccharimonadales bacterium]